ncbi:hypothetical protein KXX02_003665 [Aspergillus fumigatus]|nr:hypothetical protein KXX02_003665 [Aspergillus fumigatus]
MAGLQKTQHNFTRREEEPSGTAVRSGYCRYALTADSDMGMTEITWELDGGQISAEESVRKLVEVIRSKKLDHTGTFWTWENEEYPW